MANPFRRNKSPANKPKTKQPTQNKPNNQPKKQRPLRVAAFIDSQNLNVGVQRVGWKMDWQRFRRFLADEYGVRDAYMFIGYMPEHESLYEQMHAAGYKVVLKQTFDMTKPLHDDGDGKKDKDDERHIKGNIDADLVLWAMKELHNYDKAILVTGDGDFRSLVDYLDEKKRLLKILTPNDHYSSLFNKYEDRLLSLNSLRKKLAYRGNNPRPTKKL